LIVIYGLSGCSSQPKNSIASPSAFFGGFAVVYDHASTAPLNPSVRFRKHECPEYITQAGTPTPVTATGFYGVSLKFLYPLN
jgi:hypothetical protein